MEEIGWEEHSEALAESVNGELTSSPLVGLLTLTLANAGAAIAEHRMKVKTVFMNWAFSKNFDPLHVEVLSGSNHCVLSVDEVE